MLADRLRELRADGRHADSCGRGRFGWEDLQVTPVDADTAEVTDNPDGRRVTIRLGQPGEQGAHGVWVVTGGTSLR